MRTYRLRALGQVLACVTLLPLLGSAWAQTAPKAKPTREAILTAARGMVKANPYCALVTLDPAGAPSIRTMNPLPLEEEMTVWFATNDRSRKVLEIKKNPLVTVYFSNHQKAEGYVAVHGQASLVSDMAEILKRKRAYWDHSFPGLKHLVLIKIVPKRLEIISYQDKLTADPDTWEGPTVDFPAQ